MRKLAKILKNKKGFTLVEAIAVVAIMGILATVIGGLVTAGTTAYMRQKENAAAKDLGTIVQNEIKRAARSSVEVYLQDGDLPTDSNMITIGDTQTTYQMKNAPTGEYKVFSSSEDGRLVYSTDSGNTTQEYFTDPNREAEGRAFYGSFKINLSFAPVFDAADKTIGIKIICDVYNSKDQLKYESRGTVVYLLESQSPSFSGNIVKTYKNDISALTDIVHVDGNFYTATYVDIIGADAEKEYTHLYFRY